MAEILLIRHGETDWNVVRRLQGHLDIELNAEGQRQATAVGRALSEETIDAVFSSDMQRTMHTAQAIACPHRLPLRIDPMLRERCYGALEGLRHDEIKERYPEAYTLWRSRDIEARYPAGANQAETLQEFFARSLEAVTRLASLHVKKKIVIVTHGGVLECIYRAANKLPLAPPRDFEIRNASINRLTWDGAMLRIQSWSELSHLSELALDEINK